MNIPRLIGAVIVGFILVSGTDYLIHEVWLKPEYQATKELWRTEADMMARMPWMFGAQFLFAATFVLIWARGFAATAGLHTAIVFGILMGLFHQTYTMVMYAVMPLPDDLAIKWFCANVAQVVLLGIVTFYVYKPAAGGGASAQN
jgi:hypothetical protein